LVAYFVFKSVLLLFDGHVCSAQQLIILDTLVIHSLCYVTVREAVMYPEFCYGRPME